MSQLSFADLDPAPSGPSAWEPPLFPATRAAGLDRLAAFLPHAGRDYAARRNHDTGPGPRGNVSMLSPYIRHRLVTEAEVIEAVLRRHSASTAEKFIQEVFWRTYWKGWLEMRPSVWLDYQASLYRLIDDLDVDPDLRDGWSAAVDGSTGIACFDAWARELVETGYLHNHTRMWFASIWVFTLALPWQLGADFFLRHLVDGDPASNTLGWRWVAGLQTRGKTYLARADNIARYTGGRFNPEGELSPVAEPLDPDDVPPPASLPILPEPARGLRTGLLLTEEDLMPETLLPAGLAVDAVAAIDTTSERSPLPVGQWARAFAEGAIADTLNRVETVLGPAGLVIDPTEAVDWAAGHGLDQVVVPYAPVGPARGRLDRIGGALDRAGIDCVPLMRDWDRQAWPHATKGFFPFKEKIPRLIRPWLARVPA